MLRWTDSERSAQYLTKVHTRRSTITDPLCTPKCRNMQAWFKDRCLLVCITHDIDEMVKSCAPRQAHKVDSTKDTLIPHDVLKRAWHTLGTDLFHWNGTEYLLIADIYSKFPIIRKLTNISYSTIINHLK